MSAFSQHHVDSILWPNLLVKMPTIFDEFYPSFEQQSLDASVHDSSSIEQSNEKMVTARSPVSMSDNMAESLSPLDKKRKSKNGVSSISDNSKDVKRVKCKKPKKEKEAKKEVKIDNESKNEATDEPPKEYIHVRARRGQATDSHSLAERVRREKISERMKMLQALVPGCDKVTGKALMLDEIINYVQSLQNQVEFLSLKLASLDPMVHTFGLMDIDPLAFETEGMINNTALPMVQQMPCTTISAPSSDTAQPLTFNDTITNFPYPIVDSSPSLMQQEQRQNVLPSQEDRTSYWQVLDDQQQRQSIINQFCFNPNNFNLSSFH